MKSKKLIIISLLSLGLVAASIPVGIAISKAGSSGSPRTLSTEITPTKPGRGEIVSFLPSSLSQFWQMDNLVNTYQDQIYEISELTPYTDEMATWTSHTGSAESEKEILRGIFDRNDIFRPTNNLLAWDSKVDAKQYRVIISQDKTFATIEREYTVSGSENSVIFENPYSGTDYYWQVIATKNDDSLVYSDVFNFTSANLPRTVLIEGVSNTRDLGGNVGLQGKRMKEGLVYRGMRLEAITTAGTDEFKNKLGIKSELDLRGVGEGVENYLNLSKYYHYSSPFDYTSGNGSSSVNYGIEYFGDNSLVTNFGNAIKVMANKDNYPVFFHCSVGRDRTGWMGLCLNFLCGVSEEVAFKEFSLSLFSTSGAISKGHLELYSRFNRIVDYLNTFEGSNLSEKTEDYLVKHAGVTHEECENVRKILLGDIDTGFVPGEVNADPYTNLAKVTFRQYGQTPIIKLVEVGTLLEEPNIVGDGSWYHGDHLWDFANDVVTEDMYLDYILPSKCKVIVHYSGIDLPDDVLDVAMNTNLDLSMFNKDGYTFKVYDDSFEQIINLTVTGDVTINVVYKPTGGYIPKANSRVIVLAGQSNAAGVAHYQYLENSVDEAKIAEINNGYDNVLISGYSHDNYMTTFKKVYADKRSMTVGSPGSFGFEVGLAERLSKVFPDETTYIIKHAYGGASLNYDWISPSGMSVDILMPNYDTSKERGWLYTGLVESTTNGLQMISQMTNTTPMIEAFMWMQGESDATVEPTLNVYVSSFNALISDYTTTFANNISYKFAVYDAAICETSVWALAKQMNAAKRSRVNNTNIYIETNDRITTSFEPIGNSTDNAHYDAACYIDLGHMFADAYLEKTLRGYTHNALEIEAPAKLTLTMGQNYNMVAPSVLFNGVPVNAKMSYFAEQHKGFNDAVYAYFEVNNTNTFTPLRTGKSQLRISAYYQNEVRTVLVPVEVVAN